jgi:predicted  nucleic acid-binding Zn-ribbon protein
MHPDLEHLLQLQSRDLVLYEAEQQLQTVLDQLAAYDREVEQAKQDIETAKRNLETVAKRREEIEAKIEGLRILQDRRRQRVELAKTAREHNALATELELARAGLVREEAEWFKISERTTEAEKQVEALTLQLEALEAGQSEQRDALTEEVAKAAEERDAATAAREEASQVLGRSVYLRYDRLRQSRNSPVVVALHGAACGACFTAIPMSRRNQIRTGAILDHCEACGVILYTDDEMA